MDFDNKQELWSRVYNGNIQGEEIIENLNSYLRMISSPIGKDYQMIHQQGILTMIKVSIDKSSTNKRVLVRTETTPNTNPPKRLTKILNQEGFTPVSLK